MLPAALALDPALHGDIWNEYNLFLHDVHLAVAPFLGVRYFVFPTQDGPGVTAVPDPNRLVTPDPARPDFPSLKRHFGSVRGAWPTITSVRDT